MTALLTVLDCTFRDGGYYTNWDFPAELVDEYLRSAAEAGVDAVELGFRSPPKPRYLGPFAYTTDEFISSLELPDGPTYGVMVNASDLLQHSEGARAAVDLLFAQASQSPVSLVRIAAHFDEAARCRDAVEQLTDLGYRVGLNIMQVSRRKPEEVADLAAILASWGLLEVLYFADSLGNMGPAEVTTTVEALRRNWSGALGIHTHDNRGFGLANSLAAVDAGVSWLDGTVVGMGRGAGNVRTEFLLFELRQRLGDAVTYDAAAMAGLVANRFEPLQRQHGWGPSLFYLMSAAYDVHPTYVQTLIGDHRYQTDDVVEALEALRADGGHSFNQENLERALAGDLEQAKGSWDATEWLDGRDVVVLGSGPGARTHAGAIERYVERTGAAVLAINTNAPIRSELVTAFVACHPSRVALESSHYASLGRPLIAPGELLHALMGSGDDAVELLDFGLQVRAGTFEVEPDGCTVPARLAFAYALAVASAAGARRILLAGMDGYPAGDRRQDEMISMLRLYQSNPYALPLVAVTPSSYPVDQSSIYAPSV